MWPKYDLAKKSATRLTSCGEGSMFFPFSVKIHYSAFVRRLGQKEEKKRRHPSENLVSKPLWELKCSTLTSQLQPLFMTLRCMGPPPVPVKCNSCHW